MGACVIHPCVLGFGNNTFNEKFTQVGIRFELAAARKSFVGDSSIRIPIRRNICSRDFPSALEQDISLLPMVNWQLLPDVRSGDDSLLSYHFHEDFVVLQSRIDDLFVL